MLGFSPLIASYFNSRPREGANETRIAFKNGGYLFQFPPPRGGERGKSSSVSCILLFQFPPPRGGEQVTDVYGGIWGTFQFPPPRGGEPHLPGGTRSRKTDFNSRPRSRPREGANCAGPRRAAGCPPFQFPPPRGGERLCRISASSAGLFQFPPPRGGELQNCTK